MSKAESASKSRGRWHYAGIVLSVLFIIAMGSYRLVYPSLRIAPSTPTVDEMAYANVANSVLEGKGFDLDSANKGEVLNIPWTRKDGPTTFAPPLHILYLALLFLSGVSRNGVATADAVLIIAGSVCWYFACRRIVPGWVALAGAILFLNGNALYQNVVAMPYLTESFWIFLVMFTVFAVTIRLKMRPLYRGVMTGILCGALILTRGEALLLTPLLVLFSAPRFPRVWKDTYVAAAIVVAGLVICPWVVRNYVHTGEIVLSRNGSGYNTWIGNNPGAYDADSLSNSIANHDFPYPYSYKNSDDEASVDKKTAASAHLWMLLNPKAWMHTSFRRLLYFWQPMNFLVDYTNFWVRVGLFYLCLLGVFAVPWKNKLTWLVLSPVLVYTLVATLLLGGNMFVRFRMMMSPMEAMLIASGAWLLVRTGAAVFSPRQEKRARAIAKAVALAMATVLFGTAVLKMPSMEISRSRLAHANFEDGFGKVRPINPPELDLDTHIEGVEGKSVLYLTRLMKKGNQGVYFILPPGTCQPFREYKLEFRAKVSEPPAFRASVVAYPSMEDLNARQDGFVLNMSEFGHNTAWGEWTTFRMFFTGPHREPAPPLIVYIMLGAQRPRNWAAVDWIQISESSLMERFGREYFTEETSRRRQWRMYKDPWRGPVEPFPEPPISVKEVRIRQRAQKAAAERRFPEARQRAEREAPEKQSPPTP